PSSGLALEVRDLGGLVLDLVLGVVELLLRLALALLAGALAVQRRIAGDVAGSLLGAACDLVDDAHLNPLRVARPTWPQGSGCPPRRVGNRKARHAARAASGAGRRSPESVTKPGGATFR